MHLMICLRGGASTVTLVDKKLSLRNDKKEV
jgi:hypothetical protein